MRSTRGFTLIELLVVISIISLLISILMPSLSRARDQAKGVHCVARLKEFGNALATYEYVSDGTLPPLQWKPDPNDLKTDGTNVGNTLPGQGETAVVYGWTEILFSYVYNQEVQVARSFPVQRNVDGGRWEDYFICRAVGDNGENSGHYRAYLPAWSGHRYVLEEGQRYGDTTRADPDKPGHREMINPRLPIIGDSNDLSERGDGHGNDECSYIDAGEANYAGSDGRSNGNRFADRHHGGTNYLFQDLHAAWSPRLRDDLAKDYDLNGVEDIELQPLP